MYFKVAIPSSAVCFLAKQINPPPPPIPKINVKTWPKEHEITHSAWYQFIS